MTRIMDNKEHAIIHLHHEIEKLAGEVMVEIRTKKAIDYFLFFGIYRRMRKIQDRIEKFHRGYQIR